MIKCYLHKIEKKNIFSLLKSVNWPHLDIIMAASYHPWCKHFKSIMEINIENFLRPKHYCTRIGSDFSKKIYSLFKIRSSEIRTGGTGIAWEWGIWSSYLITSAVLHLTSNFYLIFALIFFGRASGPSRLLPLTLFRL